MWYKVAEDARRFPIFKKKGEVPCYLFRDLENDCSWYAANKYAQGIKHDAKKKDF